MKSIRTKLIIYFALLLIIASASLGALSSMYSQRALVKAAEDALSTIAEGGVKTSQGRMETQTRTLEIMASSGDINGMNWNVQKRLLQMQLKESGFIGLAVVDKNGFAQYTDDSTAELADRVYVKNALEGKSNISDVLISSVTGEPVIMVAVPIQKNGAIVGALIGRKDANLLSDIVSDIKYGESGYSYMINNKGVVIAHPDHEKVINQFSPIVEAESNKELSSLSDLFSKIIVSEKGVSTYDYDGKTQYVSYQAIEGTDWFMVITANKNEVLGSIYELRMIIIGVTIVILIVSLFLVFFVGNSIARPIIHTVKYAEKIANLDITENVATKFINRKDEIGTLSISLQSMKDSLFSIIHDINDCAEQLSSSSEEMTATTEQSSETVNEISNTVMEIARGASEQAELTQTGAEKADALGNVIERDQEYLKKMNQVTTEVEGIVKKGMEDIAYLSEKTKDNSVAGTEIEQVIMKTDSSAKKIGDASNVIASIADQTNLLALNAAIEAARAGDAGKGFSVVAEEIRKLAEQSADSTKEIDSAITDLLKNSEDAVLTIKKMLEVIEKQAESVEINRENYESIKNAIHSVAEVVENLNESGTNMESMKVNILESMQNLSAIAEENSASTEEVTASMEEQTASMAEIANASEELAKLAENLQDTVHKFRI
ncbi:MAG: methyl-accepting chemotaxis protein [Lachnospiraceae bacterium]|nr:methyl-accepting chemotaxis protein [Lachnospiraceae bacterium]